VLKVPAFLIIATSVIFFFSLVSNFLWCGVCRVHILVAQVCVCDSYYGCAFLCKNLLERNINNREIHTCFLKLNVKINVYIGTFSKGVSLQEMAFRQGVWLLAFLKATSQRKTGLGYLPPPSLSLTPLRITHVQQ